MSDFPPPMGVEPLVLTQAERDLIMALRRKELEIARTRAERDAVAALRQCDLRAGRSRRLHLEWNGARLLVFDMTQIT